MAATLDTEAQAPPVPALPKSCGSHISFRQLLSSGDYSDLTIVTTEKEYKLHKAIILSKSTILQMICKHGKAGPLPACGIPHVLSARADAEKQQEAAEGRIDLSADDPKIIKCMIDFLYTGEYKEFQGRTAFKEAILTNGCLMIHAEVYAIATKYDVSELQDTAEELFTDALMIPGAWHIEALMDVFRFIYNSTPENDRGLRDVVVRKIADREIVAESNELAKLVLEDGMQGLACDLFRQAIKKKQSETAAGKAYRKMPVHHGQRMTLSILIDRRFERPRARIGSKF